MALHWIWDYYWKHLVLESASTDQKNDTPNACQKLALRCLKEDNLEKRKILLSDLRGHGETAVLVALGTIIEEARDAQLLHRAVSLSREVLNPDRLATEETETTDRTRDFELVRSELEEKRQQLQDADHLSDQAIADASQDADVDLPSWSRHDAHTWVPKPIGIV
jgi:hypothetical protein